MQINKIHIKSFKSLYDMAFEPGHVNVLIGANGSGKTTVLEAIGIISAAMSDRVNDNSLQRIGVRQSAPSMYKSRFQTIKRPNPSIDFELEWMDGQSHCQYAVNLMPPAGNDSFWRYLSEAVYQDQKLIMERDQNSKEVVADDIGNFMLSEALRGLACRRMGKLVSSYGIYQPETPVLRGTMADPVPSVPLGLSGGRLANAIQDIVREDDGEMVMGDLSLEEVLDLIDWAASFHISTPKKTTLNAGVSSPREVIQFKDRFLKNNAFFTGYDASEGALYILFMLTLAMHPDSPSIFSIDNFDHALNPRLVRELTKIFSREVLTHDRTVFLTTHNPLVLDGLDLTDDRIRLFTVDRNEKGYTCLTRVKVSKSLIDRQMPLSRLWVDGYLGGMSESL